MAEKDTGRESSVAEDARLQALEERLEAAKRTEALKSAKRNRRSGGANYAHRAVSELIGGPVGGAVVGWFFDWLFGTYPWLMLSMMFLGFIVAVRNVYVMTSKRPD
ncbi:AtpZ/AtpI family protein [Parasphingopyxis sp.]|uniref:AtpZ/AtpI family protein n=1 Tax=Parasphingopyxis sp. TaxID=1920299 RepID=UPI002624862D|nr:AtpZ/AtpI family protein [Parasphingopyxis sp.]